MSWGLISLERRTLSGGPRDVRRPRAIEGSCGRVQRFTPTLHYTKRNMRVQTADAAMWRQAGIVCTLIWGRTFARRDPGRGPPWCPGGGVAGWVCQGARGV